MKRDKFLAALFVAVLMPIQIFASIKKINMGNGKGFKVKSGEGRLHGHIKLKGVNANILDLKISGQDSEGGIAIFEQTSISQGMGTPLHLHHFQNEIFYVLEGEYIFKVGDDIFNLSEGESIFLPKKIPHAWTQVSQKGKMEVTFQPAGKMENFFVTVAALDHEPTKEEMSKIFSDNEMEIVGTVMKYDRNLIK